MWVQKQSGHPGRLNIDNCSPFMFLSWKNFLKQQIVFSFKEPWQEKTFLLSFWLVKYKSPQSVQKLAI